MESVERVTAGPAEESALLATVEPPVDSADDAAPTKAAVDDASDRPVPDGIRQDRDPWQPLLEFAHTLLTEMAQPPGQKEGRPSPGVVRRDPQSGEPYLHLPVPDRDKMARLLDALRDVLTG
jgi:hypothetical protein